MRYCNEDEIEDYDYDEDSVDCEIPPSTAPKFTYAYNDERICPVGTTCTSGNKCGQKGIMYLNNINTTKDSILLHGLVA